MAKYNVYYLGFREGVGKESGKPWKAVNVLEYNQRWGKWSETQLFVDELPKLCPTLTSGDLVEIEMECASATSLPRLVDIVKKISDSPLINPKIGA